MPTQGHAALLISILAVAITMTILYLGTRNEKKRPNDTSDDH